MSTLGRNIAFPIYNGDGTSFHDLVIKKSTSDSIVMSLGDKVTGDVYYKDNTLECNMDEYILVDGVKYSIVNPPTIVREGLKSENGDLKGMTKYSFEFYHPMYMLGNMAFSDVAVTNAESMFKSHDRTFSWIGNLTDYVAKLNKNLQNTQFIVSISSSIDTDSRKVLSDVLSFTNNTIADALKTAYDTWHFPFVVDAIKSGEQYYNQGKRFLIQFGNPTREILDSNNQPFVFHFGKGVGLKNNSRTPRNNKIVTRVAGYGSEQNIPYGYPQIPWTGDPSATQTADGYPIYEGIVGGVVTKLVKHPFTRTHLMPSVYAESVRKKVDSAAADYDNTTPLVDYYDAPSTYPNPINIAAPKLDIVGIETIKPELGDMAILGVTPLNNDLTPASSWDDTMDDDGNYTQSYFKITLPQLDFDIYACASITEEMKINMRSGACIGCTFDAQVDWDDYKKNFFDAQGNFLPNGEQRDLTKYPKSNDGSIDLIVKKDLNTYGTLMPNVYQKPTQGDKFVILGISMPSTYITNAEERLDAALMTHMLDNNVYYYDYPLKFDEDFFYNHTDILSQVRPNSVLRFTFGGVEKSLYIKQITIKYGEGVLPKYDITLTDNIEVVLNQIGLVADDVSRLAMAMMQMNKRTNINITNTESLQKYVDYTIMPNLESIQRQLDGSQVTYFGNENPFDASQPYSDGKYVVDPTKFPASEWDDDYSEHDGDMFYNRETGKGYEFTIIDNSSSPVVYGWQLIQDEDIIQALTNAQNAQDTADGKRRVFICDASHHTPNPPYDVGDLWVNVKYPYATGATYDDEILKCVVAKTEDQTFDISDWSLANGYTAALRNFINGTYADNLQEIQTQIDGKAETWYQNTDPSTAWTTTALKNQHKGDIWHNSSNTTINGVKAGQDAIWDGTQWVVDETVPQAIYDEIDGKCAIYVTWGAWGNDLQEKDLFIPAADTTQDGTTYKANKVYRCVDKDTPTFQEIAYTDDTQYNGFITKLIGSSGQTKDAAENAIAAIKHALSDGNTYNEGGLILSNLISLGTGSPTSGTFTPWAGISGIYKTSETGTGYKGHGIAAWFGGGMVDGEVSQSATNAAKSLFRFDGSGYVADGNLSWDKNGNVTIQGYSINATTLQVGGSNVATESSISSFFANFFDIYNGSTQITYEQYVALQDKSNVSLKAKHGLWTEQFLSALGMNSQGGGTGGGGVSSIRVSSSSVITPDSDGIVDLTNYVSTANERNAWNNASSMAHTHSNKSVLDGITSAKVTSWDAVAAIMGEDPDEIINKWNEIIAFLLNIPEQTTLEQLLAAKANSTVQIIAGNGLTGGGNLQENRTINVASANAAITVNTDNIKLNVINDYVTTTNNTIIPLAAAKGKDLNDRLAVLESWFEVDAAGNIKTKDMPNGTHRGFYTESFVSALGSNSEGGGSGAGLEDVWDSLTNQQGTVITDNTKIAIAHIPDTSSTYGYLKSSALNGYATQSWVNQQGFLTTHQSIYALTLKAGGTAVTTFTPNSADASLDFVAGSNISLTRGTNQISIANTYSYTLPLAASGTRGGVQIGYSESNSGTSTTRNYAVKLSSEKMYVNVPWTDTTYKLTLNGTTNGASGGTSLGSFYAPTASGTANQVLISGGSNTAPSWTAQSNLSVGTAAKLGTGTTTYSAWGQTYWSSGVPQSISGNMTSVGSITPSANGNALGTTSARFNIYGTAGNFSGNVSITGTLRVTGATTLTGLLTANGGIVVPSSKTIKIGDCTISWDSTNSMLKFDTGIYSTGAVSALGANSSGGGGGGVDLDAMWASLMNTVADTYASSKIATAHIPNLAASKITSGTFAAARIPIATASAVGGIKVGTTLAISDGVLNQKSGIATAGTYRSVTVDTYGRVTAGTNPTTLSGYGITNAYTKTQVDTALSGYLPLSGGTLTGTLTVPKIRINTRHSSGDTRGGIYYYNGTTDYLLIGQGSSNLWIGANETSGTHHTGGTYISAGSGDAAISRLVNGSRINYIILDAGNYSSYALPLSGGTLTGSLAIKFDADSSRVSGYTWLNTSGTSIASIRYHNTAQNIILNPVGSSDTWSDAVGKYSLIVGNNKLTYNTYTILHSNNYSSYALPLSGGTLTGNVTFNGVNKGIYLTDSGGNTFAGIIQNGTNLWIGAQQITATHHTGGTYISAGDNRNLYVSKLVDNTRTNYIILDTDNTYVSSGKGYINGTEITTISGNAATASLLSYSHTNEINFKGGMQVNCFFNYRNADSDSSDGGTTAINYRFCNYSSSTAYSTVYAGTFIGAFSGNATTATTLQTPRTIWGESFNGSANVSGAMTGVTSITMSSHIIMNNNTSVYIKDTNGTALRMLTVNDNNQYFLGFDAKQKGYTGFIDANNLYLRCTTALYLQTSLVTLNAGARISKGGASGSQLYIGDTNNSGWVRLQDMCSQTGTAGDTYWSIRNGGNAIFKEVTATSDERKKNILGDTTFSVKDIADTRSILFEWKDNTGLEKKVHGGSIAQDWFGKADWALTLGDDGYYSLNYGALALCSAITIAREVLKHEDEITRLKKVAAKQAKEIVDLKNRVNELEERRVA